MDFIDFTNILESREYELQKKELRKMESSELNVLVWI